MIISTFNIVGSLSMLMLDKEQDIKTFKSFGSSEAKIRTLFFAKSMFTVITGLLVGLVIGLTLAFLQQNYGFISMGSNGSFVVDSYPVSLKFGDVIIVSLTVLVIGLLASWYPAKVLSRKLFKF